MAKVETVTVCHPDHDGPMIINEDDFDPEVHTIYEGEIQSVAEGGGKEPGEEISDPKESGDEEPQGTPLNKMKRGELVECLEKAGGNLADIEGTGKGGAVKNEDIAKAIQELESKEK